MRTAGFYAIVVRLQFRPKSRMFTRPEKRLLFVDDEPKIRATLPVILRRYGFTVTVAATVAEAVNHIRSNEFDLLLCDLNIEREGDGYDVVRAIRESNPRCVVIILTGFPAVKSAVDGIHEQIDDYILKPSNPDHLVASLAEKLAKRQPKARILSVSYDEVLLKTRALLLEYQGYEVVSCHEFDTALTHCKEGGFDLLILGHSIPDSDKQKFFQAFRQTCRGSIISLCRSTETSIEGSDFQIDPDPERLLKLVDEVIRQRPSQSPRA